MRRNLSMLLALALLATSAFGLAGPVKAHPVNLDPALETTPPNQEWNTFGVYKKPFSETNLGRVIRNTQQQGEYAWQDATGLTPDVSDARIISGAGVTQTRQLDIRQFRVTGTATDLYVYVNLVQLSSLGGILQSTQRPFLPQLQLGIDLGSPSAGASEFVAPAKSVATGGTQIKNKWEYLVQTQFDNIDAQVDYQVNKINAMPPLVYASATPATGTATGDGILSQDGNSIELRVPWASIGGKPAANTPVRFSVATLRSDGATPSDASTSNIADVVSRTVNDAVVGNDPTDTVAAITRGGSNNQLDYAPQVYFDGNGEPFSPLVVSEISIRPKSQFASAINFAQWFEIANTSPTASFSLNGYKAGDASDPNGNEAMFQLPNVTLAPNQALIFARQRNAFKNVYGNTLLSKTYEMTTTNTIGDASSAGFQLTPYSGWAGLQFSLSTSVDGGDGTLKDQVVLLNDDDTLSDLVEFANGAVVDTAWYPEQQPIPVTVAAGNQTVADNTTFVRCPFTRDTNSGPTDFITITTLAAQTPGTPTCSIADLYTSVAGPAGVVVDALNATSQNYTVTYGNNRADVVGATIAITLPRAMTLGSATSTPDIGQPTVGIATDGRVLLTWSNVSSTFGTQGTINLALNVPAGTNPNPATNLQATFNVGSGTTDSDTTNNSTSYAIAYSAQPFADVGIGITNKSTAEFFPGGKIVYGVTVTNAGPKQSDNVTVEIDVPDILTYKSNSLNFPATVTGNKVTLNLGQVPAGAPTTATILIDVEFTVKVTATVGATAQATAVVKTTTTPETPLTNNNAASSVITVQNPPDAPNVKITAALKNTTPVKQGDIVTYVLTVSNVGTQPVAPGQIVVIDDFPEDQLDYISYNSTADIGELKLATLVRLSLRSGLAAGQSVTIEVVFSVKSSLANNTQIVNKVSVPRVTGESTDGDNNADATLTVNPVTTGGTNKVYLPLVFR